MGIWRRMLAGRFGRFPAEERGALEEAHTRLLRAVWRSPGFVTGMALAYGLALYLLLRSMAPGPVGWDSVRTFAGALLRASVIAGLSVLLCLAIFPKWRKDRRQFWLLGYLLVFVGTLMHIPTPEWEFLVYAAITALVPGILVDAVATAGVVAARDRAAGAGGADGPPDA